MCARGLRCLAAGRALGCVLMVSAAARAAAPDIDAAKIDEYVNEQITKVGYPSLSIGIVRDQGLIFARSYGVADRKTDRKPTPDSLYSIGSVTKVFTTTLMCILRDRGVVRLDDSIAKYLPESVTLPTDPRGAPAITLRHLATHSSGLAKLPPNLMPVGDDPYGGYTVKQLYAGLPQAQLAYPTGAQYRYSNLGMGLLGHVLERATGEAYEPMLIKYLLDPLGMESTRINLSAEQRERFATGYHGERFAVVAPEWDLGCLAGAGGLASSVTDLGKFLALQMRAGQAAVEWVSGGTLTELHTPQRLTDGWDGAVGLGWHITPVPEMGDVIWHNGGTAGHFAFIGFVPEAKIGLIVLTNSDRPVDEVAWTLLAITLDLLKGPATQAQDLPAADKILARYVEATGGATARQNVRNVVVRGKATIADMALEYEAYNAAPSKAYMRMWTGPMTLVEEGTDGQTAWEISAVDGPRIQTGTQRAMALRGACLHRDLKWRELYSAAKCEGVADFAGQRCFRVVMTPNVGADEIRYYNAQTSLLAGMETSLETPMFGEVPLQEVYDDYKTFDGIIYPCKVAQKLLGTELTLTVESVEHNADIPADRFAIPPAIVALMQQQPTTAPTSAPAAK